MVNAVLKWSSTQQVIRTANIFRTTNSNDVAMIVSHWLNTLLLCNWEGTIECFANKLFDPNSFLYPEKYESLEELWCNALSIFRQHVPSHIANAFHVCNRANAKCTILHFGSKLQSIAITIDCDEALFGSRHFKNGFWKDSMVMLIGWSGTHLQLMGPTQKPSDVRVISCIWVIVPVLRSAHCSTNLLLRSTDNTLIFRCSCQDRSRATTYKHSPN